MIDSIDGLQKMDGLVKLSLQGNEIQDVDLTSHHWSVYPFPFLPAFMDHKPTRVRWISCLHGCAHLSQLNLRNFLAFVRQDSFRDAELEPEQDKSNSRDLIAIVACPDCAQSR